MLSSRPTVQLVRDRIRAFRHDTVTMQTVSIIIPTFNRAHVIGAAIESALAQTGDGIDLDIIIIDDGSTDATADAVAIYQNRIRYFYTENSGVSAARNRGIRESRSDWIAFLDSDDLWHPKKLILQLECLRKTASRVCFCCSQSDSCDPLDDLLKMDPRLIRYPVQAYAPGDTRIITSDWSPYVQSMIAHKPLLLSAGGFDETLYVAEDLKLIYHLALSHGYSVVGKTLVTITRNRHKSGLSDAANPDLALRRAESSLRLHSDIMWRLIPLNISAARIARGRMLYYASRAAELSAALRMKQRSQYYASYGLAFQNGWKSFFRCLFIIFGYPFAQRHFSSKWRFLASRHESYIV